VRERGRKKEREREREGERMREGWEKIERGEQEGGVEKGGEGR